MLAIGDASGSERLGFRALGLRSRDCLKQLLQLRMGQYMSSV